MVDWSIAIEDARSTLAASMTNYVQPMTNGSMRSVLYAPEQIDAQTPHTQDELYVVTRGLGWFERDRERVAFATGDLIFVPAGMAHRFVDFTGDFECWAIFWGPKGGEN